MNLPPFDPAHHEAHPEPEAYSLPDLVVYLDHCIEDLDIIDETITNQRHQTLDPSVVVELHAIGDDVSMAWAITRRAKTALENLVATL